MGAKSFAWGAISGAAIGITMAVLFAPQSGEETREQLATAADDLRESAATILNQARDTITETANTLEDALGLQERKVRRKMDELKAELAKFNEEAS